MSYTLRKGGGESIVLIHGLGACMDGYRDIWDFPGYQNYSILTYDLLGFGDSERPMNFSYSMEAHAEVSQLLIKELNLNNIHLVGHSMGGAIGLLVCPKMKPIIKSFVCAEGNLISEDCTGSREAVGYSLEDFQKEGFDNLKSQISIEIKGSSGKDKSLDLYLECLSKCDPYAFYRSSESLVKWSDSGKLLKLFVDLDIAKYYLFGDKNRNSPTVKLLSTVPKVEITNAGHAMMNDNPQEFYQKLLEVL